MKFWKWFTKNEALINRILSRGNEEQKAALKEHLDTFILELGRFSWEINPQPGGYQLVISPNRDPELFKASQNIVAQAPALNSWEFLPAKPQNKTLQAFTLYDESINLVHFTPQLWHSSDLSFSEIEVYAPEFEKPDRDTCIFACEMALTAWLGEASYIALSPRFFPIISTKTYLRPIPEWSKKKPQKEGL